MIEVLKVKNIKDEKDRKAVLELIEKKEEYYNNLLQSLKNKPRIVVRFEGEKPAVVSILFSFSGSVEVINTSGYASFEAVTKHAFKKLRRVTKRYFLENKRRRFKKNMILE